MQQSLFAPEISLSNDFTALCAALGAPDGLSPDAFGERLRHVMPPRIGRPLRTLALFSGGGGLDIGFSDAGFEVVETVEIEEKFVRTLRHNQAKGHYLQHAKITCQDVCEYQPAFTEPIDFIIGGPPCQSFSAAGRRAAGVAGTRDARGGLFEEYVRLLAELQPRGFLFENVYGLLGAEKGAAITKIAAAFREVGYDIAYRVLDAADYGVPQHRERLIIVGQRMTTGQPPHQFHFPRPTHGPDADGTPHYTASDALTDVPTTEPERLPSINGRFGHLLREVPEGLNYSFFTEKMGHPAPIFAWRSKFSDFLYKADSTTPIRTLKASGGQYTGPFHWESRHFTLAELKRLQTFPDAYELVGNRAIVSKQIGNSVPPQFARLLALSVLDQVFGIALPFPLHYLSATEALGFRSTKAQKTTRYQSKAQEAGTASPERPDALPVRAATYRATLTKKHRLVLAPAGPFEVAFSPTPTRWAITVHEPMVADHVPPPPVYQLTVRRASGEPLFAQVSTVELAATTPTLAAFTLLWKAFEREVTGHHLKADLVQLNGYYQYPSDLRFGFERLLPPATADAATWRVVEAILADPDTNQIRPLQQLAWLYDVPVDALHGLFQALRLMGYEIRNSNTNPEIPAGQYLIPYRFPTLTHLSVQLKRAL